MIDEKRLVADFDKYIVDVEIPQEHEKSVLKFMGVYYKTLIDCINNQPKIGEWIPCSERLPEEHKSMFAKFKGTDKWSNAMFESCSDDVNVTVEFEDGSRKTMTLHTCDGEWKTDIRIVKFKVIAWQPLPETYQEDK